MPDHNTCARTAARIPARSAASTAFIACLAAACGGGGGSGGGDDGNDGGASGSESNPPPSEPSRLAITASNAIDVFVTTFWAAESVYLNSELMTSATAILEIEGDDSVSIACGNESGTIAIAQVDADEDSTLSSGDSVHVTYEGCEGTEGDVSLVIDEVDTFKNSLNTLSGAIDTDLTLSGAGPDLAVQAAQEMEFSVEDSAPRWNTTDAELDTSGGSFDLALSGATVDRSIDSFDGTYALSITGSGRLDGEEFDISTSEDFTGSIGEFPTQGRMLINGGDSAAELRSGTGSNPELARYSLESGGSGGFGPDTSVRWDSFTSGLLFGIEPPTEEVSPPDDPPGDDPPVVSDLEGRSIDLGGRVQDGVVDRSRERIYVSLPDRNEVAFLDSETLRVTDRAYIGPGPHGLVLSDDGTRLYAALNQAGAVGALDLETLTHEIIPVATELGDARASDVAEASPGELFVVADPGSSGISYLARIDRMADETVTRVGDDTVVRSAPHVLAGENERWLFVSDANSLYKVDADDPTAPIVLETPPGTPAGGRMSLSPDETLIYLEPGVVLRTESFVVEGRIGEGIPVPLPNGTDVVVGTSDYALEIFSASSYEELDSLTTDCGATYPPDALLRLDVPGQWLFLGGDGLCAVDINNPDDPPGEDDAGTAPNPVESIPTSAIETLLPAISADLELDAARGLVYVSFPDDGTVVSYSLDTLATVETFMVGGEPVGIDLGPGGGELAIAFRDTGQLGFLDVESGHLERAGLSDVLGDLRGHDVVYEAADSVFISANPSSNGSSWIVRTNRSNPEDAAVRVADGTIIRARPELLADPAASRLYVGAGFSPNSLYALDTAQPAAPIVVEDEHGSVGGTHRLSLSPDGESLALASGQIVRTSNLTQGGRVGSGVVSFSNDGQTIVAAEGAGDLHRYSAATFRKTSVLHSDCAVTTAERLAEVPAAGGWALLGEQVLCVLSAPGSPAPSKSAPQATGKLIPSYRCDDDCLMRRYVLPRLNDPSGRGFRPPQPSQP